MSVLIIAEAGVNHGGDLAIAKKLVHAAAAAGADIVKFQTFNASKLTTKSSPKAAYQLESTSVLESQRDMIAKLELTARDHEQLVVECQKCGIKFLSTGFDTDSIDFLVGLGIEQIKIPSGEITNLPLLRHMASTKLPLILSTGMSNLGEVEHAIQVLETEGVSRDDICVLHCNTEYPTPMSDVNLTAMKAMELAFGVRVGYSDHTLGMEIPIAATALGASVVEKHLTLDRTLPGPDQAASLEPDEFKQMVRAVRNVSLAIGGDGIKRPSASEKKNIEVARRSIVAACFIAKGEIFSAANMTTKRPGSGLSPMLWDRVVGRTACRDFAEDESIEL